MNVVLRMVCNILPFLSTMCKQSSPWSAVMTENPDSELQNTVCGVGLTSRLNEAEELTT